jgi:hypothetical protein
MIFFYYIRCEKFKRSVYMEQNTNVILGPENPRRSKKKLFLLISILLLVLASVAAGAGYFYKQKKEEEYKKQVEKYGEDLNFLVMNMLNTGADAEGMINTYIDVWHEAIFNNKVEVGGQNYYDFDSALAAQKIEFEKSGKIEELQKSLDKTEKSIRKLNNPPKKYKEAYELAVDMYKSHKEFVEYAITPRGSYQSYSDDAQELSQEFINLYDEYNIKVPKTYIEDLEEDLEKNLKEIEKDKKE